MFALFFLYTGLSFSQHEINTKENLEVIALLNSYPHQSFVGCYGESDMRKTLNNRFRDFGVYRRARIKFVEFKLDEKQNEIVFQGKSMIHGLSTKPFDGIIKITLYRDFFIPKNTIDLSSGRIIYDSTKKTEVVGDFTLTYVDKSIYQGKVKFMFKSIDGKNEIDQYGISLLGNYQNKEFNFGYITPSSSGIFRSKPGSTKMCINKNLIELGWASYIYANPQWFDCYFDSFTDKLSPIIKTQIEIEKFKLEELREW